MNYQRIDLFGSAWQTVDGHAPPVVYGSVKRNFDADCTGVYVGVTALQTRRDANEHAVADFADGADALFVARLSGERFYDGLAPSLVQRVASEHGTATPWRLVYR